jgi:hypothetical protein
MDEKRVAERVERVLVELDREGEVEIAPSAISGSPHKYVYIYLTPEAFEGRHLLISDRQEMESEAGFIVGDYLGVDQEADAPEDRETLDEVCAWVRERVESR